MLVYLQMIETEEDRSKFTEVYIAYRGLMYHVAYEILQNVEDAEDAVHQAFVKIAENINKIDAAVCPKTKSYVVTIVENRAIDVQRFRSRHQEVPYNDGAEGLSVEYTGSFVIAQCLSRLTPRYREVLILKHRHGYTNKEIAKMLDLTEANAIKLEQRAKAKLFELCKEEGVL